ncbi:hypothetical protein RM780_21805 [Streptomyces sp. DSM 44917]|uniref:STAS domain-containing protein n=1 Tax=Streptomyces boetiae TaxID=3075541 RepID=A0ABU2LDB9_9ACTN|nr:hypothetical protein [Streptomyces sp. DSM 44917]MDT0309572.1 hypothetical protein [Streptomyces sp. DSM 44917]
MAGNELGWRSLRVTLEVTGGHADAETLVALDVAGDDPAQLLGAVLSQLEPLADALAALRAEGHAARIRMEGWVETGACLAVPPDLLARVAALGLPLAFATRADGSTETEDFLSSLGS